MKPTSFRQKARMVLWDVYLRGAVSPHQQDCKSTSTRQGIHFRRARKYLSVEKEIRIRTVGGLHSCGLIHVARELTFIQKIAQVPDACIRVAEILYK